MHPRDQEYDSNISTCESYDRYSNGCHRPVPVFLRRTSIRKCKLSDRPNHSCSERRKPSSTALSRNSHCPHERFFGRMAHRTGLAPSQCLQFGENLIQVRAGRDPCPPFATGARTPERLPLLEIEALEFYADSNSFELVPYRCPSVFGHERTSKQPPRQQRNATPFQSGAP